MTKQEQIDKIKKSLAICVGDSCEGCAYHDNLTCIDTLKNDARKCIIKQEKEIEKLKDELKQLKTNSKILARGVRDLNHENYKLTEKIKQVKIDVLSELRTYCVERENYKGIQQQQNEDLLRRNDERKFHPELTLDEIFAIRTGADKANGQSTMANKVVEKIDRMIEELNK